MLAEKAEPLRKVICWPIDFLPAHYRFLKIYYVNAFGVAPILWFGLYSFYNNITPLGLKLYHQIAVGCWPEKAQQRVDQWLRYKA